MSNDDKTCFVIAPIGEADSETRKRSDQVLRHIIRPATMECGYTAIRADEIDKPGIITSQVIQHVVSDQLVIADLTDTNPNVFYELAIRHAIRKPLVQIIKKGERIPFDVAATRTIYFDHHDLDSVEAAKREIVNQITSLESAPGDLETPISVSLDLQVLRQSDNPEERSLADLVSAISDLRTGFAKLEERITSGKAAASGEMQEILDSFTRRLLKDISMGQKGVRLKRPIDPYMIRDLTHILPRKSAGPIGILVITSFYKDQFPWLYEIGLEAYRKASSGDWEGARVVIKELRMMAEMTLREPWMEEWVGGSKEAFLMMEELPFILDRFAEESLENRKTRKNI